MDTLCQNSANNGLKVEDHTSSSYSSTNSSQHGFPSNEKVIFYVRTLKALDIKFNYVLIAVEVGPERHTVGYIIDQVKSVINITHESFYLTSTRKVLSKKTPLIQLLHEEIERKVKEEHSMESESFRNEEIHRRIRDREVPVIIFEPSPNSTWLALLYTLKHEARVKNQHNAVANYDHAIKELILSPKVYSRADELMGLKGIGEKTYVFINNLYNELIRFEESNGKEQEDPIGAFLQSRRDKSTQKKGHKPNLRADILEFQREKHSKPYPVPARSLETIRILAKEGINYTKTWFEEVMYPFSYGFSIFVAFHEEFQKIVALENDNGNKQQKTSVLSVSLSDKVLQRKANIIRYSGNPLFEDRDKFFQARQKLETLGFIRRIDQDVKGYRLTQDGVLQSITSINFYNLFKKWRLTKQLDIRPVSTRKFSSLELIVDSREQDNKDRIIARLGELGINSKIETLFVGDYLWVYKRVVATSDGDQEIKTILPIVIERKTRCDLSDSAVTTRLSTQETRMRDGYHAGFFRHSMFFIEGTNDRDTINHLSSEITDLTYDLAKKGHTIVLTHSIYDTIDFFVTLTELLYEKYCDNTERLQEMLRTQPTLEELEVRIGHAERDRHLPGWQSQYSECRRSSQNPEWALDSFIKRMAAFHSNPSSDVHLESAMFTEDPDEKIRRRKLIVIEGLEESRKSGALLLKGLYKKYQLDKSRDKFWDETVFNRKIEEGYEKGQHVDPHSTKKKDFHFLISPSAFRRHQTWLLLNLDVQLLFIDPPGVELAIQRVIPGASPRRSLSTTSTSSSPSSISTSPLGGFGRKRNSISPEFVNDPSKLIQIAKRQKAGVAQEQSHKKRRDPTSSFEEALNDFVSYPKSPSRFPPPPPTSSGGVIDLITPPSSLEVEIETPEGTTQQIETDPEPATQIVEEEAHTPTQEIDYDAIPDEEGELASVTPSSSSFASSCEPVAFSLHADSATTFTSSTSTTAFTTSSTPLSVLVETEELPPLPPSLPDDGVVEDDVDTKNTLDLCSDALSGVIRLLKQGTSQTTAFLERVRSSVPRGRERERLEEEAQNILGKLKIEEGKLMSAKELFNTTMANFIVALSGIAEPIYPVGPRVAEMEEQLRTLETAVE